MHATWNLICKSRKPSGAFFLIATTASVIFYLPVILYLSFMLKYIPNIVWVFLFFTGIAQAVYYINLGKAYEICEVSIAYPLIRSLPVLFIPILMFFFNANKNITIMAFVGMVILALGCVILAMQTVQEFLKNIFSKAYIFIVLSAIGTTSYTIIDSKALHTLKSESSLFTPIKTTLLYMGVENILILFILALYLFFSQKERGILKELLKDRVWQPMLSGVVCSVSYTIILVAMLFVSNVSYLAAFRQISIPLGVILGIVILKEKLSYSKIIGVTLISIGLVIVALY
jgi:uncharacterized membrane protein